MKPRTALLTLPLIAVGLSLLAAPTRAQEGQDLIKKSDCMACHQPDVKVVGPSFREIAGKYGPADIPKLVAKVKQGGAGSWGQIPMAPHPALSDADLGKMIGWILSAHAASAAPAP